MYIGQMSYHDYYVYFLTNKERSVLYVGITNDLERRLHEHVSRKNPHSFTSRYNCYFIVYYEHYTYVNDAIEREKEVKGWSRKKKNALIETENKNWDFLNNLIINDN